MKRTILLLMAVSLLLCLCACAEKKTENDKPTEALNDPILTPNHDKTPLTDFENTNRQTEETLEPLIGADAEALPTLTWPQIPDPEPVEPDTEVADS